MKMKVRNKAAFTDAETFLEKENKKVSYEAALEGIVLLENDGILPLEPGKIALYGAGADMTIKGGTGSGEVHERHVVSILEGLENAGFTVTTKRWIREYAEEYEKGEEAFAKEFQRRFLKPWKLDMINFMSTLYQYPYGQPVTKQDVQDSDTDTCIYVVARQAGEGTDRKLEKKEYQLSGEEKANLTMCAANYEKMIVVINVGSVFDLSFLDEIPGINAVVYYAQQGMMGGQAFADLLCGKESPSGKTSDTWPNKYEDIPGAMDYSYLNGNVDEEYYREGIYVGYRYFDSYGVEPRYPFGYGLSYTTFSIEKKQIRVEGTSVTAAVTVTNTGEKYAGKEVVQLYASCPQTGMKKEYQKLAAFAKTKELNPGESQELFLEFDVRDLASFREEDASYVLEAGDYMLRLGNSSRNTQAMAVLELKKEVVTQTCRHICGQKEKVEEIVPPMGMDTTEYPDGDLEHLVIEEDAIETKIHSYEEQDRTLHPRTETLINRLSAEEMCDLVAGDGGAGGKKFFEAPGSAGCTTSELIEKGIPNVCMADGPAGLRLQKVSAVTRRGRLKATEPYISVIGYLPGAVKKVMMGDPKKQPCVYQFTTSFPVGLALAQSWNTELIERIGEAVGKEMEAYGVTYWLAPGMNIHRNPLCGRNFEYFSEDPLLSGKMAAAMSRGVQSRRGCFVTIKHFCCNNQEENRNRTNANVNERTLREIYLKGFEIAVKEGRPGAVMTSYNKVNGTYANNSYDLVTRVLRNEWGFEGLVMTDWYATGKGLGSHVKAIEAGNDLLMPGGKSVARELKQALKAGNLDKSALHRCAGNVLEGILSSRIYQAYRRMQK
nr:glycoside hydrolase family 3 N-terminal domain-containing protein [uncultured Merdimonas sp.]